MNYEEEEGANSVVLGTQISSVTVTVTCVRVKTQRSVGPVQVSSWSWVALPL